MTPGWAATEGDAADGDAADGIADASVGATDAAALGAFFAPLLAASFVVILPGAADDDDFPVVDAVEAGAACPDVVDLATWSTTRATISMPTTLPAQPRLKRSVPRRPLSPASAAAP